MLCALWHPELIFSESSTYEKVEGFTIIPPNKRRRDCDICQRSNVGACVKCDGCSKQIHVSCAWTAGYKFGFEMAPPRRKRNRELEFVKFKDQEGILEPKLWCPAHFPGPGRIIYGLSDRDEATNLTVVQTYATNFKTTGPAPGIAILRKARRLDAVLASVLTTKGILSTDNVGKRSDLKDEYTVSSLGVLPPTSSVPPPVVEPTLMAPPRQRRPSGNQAGESVSRGKPRAKPRAGRVRVRSKGKARARGASRTDSITQEPSKENAVGEVADDDEDQGEEAQEDNAHMSRSTDAEQRSATNNSPRAVNDQNSHQTLSLQPSYTSMVSLAPVASSSRPGPIGASLEIFDGPRRSGKPSQTPPVLSLQSANLAVSLPKSPRVEQQISSGDLRTRQFTVSQSTQPQQIVPSPAIPTPRMPTLQKTNKLRLTIKPAAPSSIPLVRPTLEPELVPKEPVRISSTAAFPFVSTSNPAAYMSHMPRPMSSASSCSSSSSKPHVTRLPSINQLDSFHSTMPGLHRLAPLPPMNIPTSSPSGIDPQGKSAAPLGSTSFRHPSLANSLQHASNPTPILPIRGTAPLLNPPSFDAFAAAAAAHTTKSANNKVPGAQPGSSVGPDSPHRNLELNATRLLNKAIHLS
ncbi:hypothetical protein CROQUDRAFT_391822 [Cronartium quercuum f. sp. fusiforme G11]|uniref:PHD-type domain-containing protein n=1 Tax=Cronartium quercuum f. sp. fusiforme G11 TaxID=708437 RepID=A0A9P6NQV3_9BASI|nr:hypothetical protein CROQUDRAFT_391822 [Cronartium quercuum f. sp. fusiforme G11]